MAAEGSVGPSGVQQQQQPQQQHNGKVQLKGTGVGADRGDSPSRDADALIASEQGRGGRRKQPRK